MSEPSEIRRNDALAGFLTKLTELMEICKPAIQKAIDEFIERL